MTGGRPLAQAYTSVAESKRWMNRFPIANESSDQDVGGGVSLAVSDLDDTPDASHHSHTSGENDEETPTPPTRVPSNLKGDAKPFVPIVGPASVETTPTSVESAVMRTVDIRSVSSMMAVSQPDSIKKSASVHTSATQIATIEPVQPVDPQPKVCPHLKAFSSSYRALPSSN
jgi:hypothetical protein